MTIAFPNARLSETGWRTRCQKTLTIASIMAISVDTPRKPHLATVFFGNRSIMHTDPVSATTRYTRIRRCMRRWRWCIRCSWFCRWCSIIRYSWLWRWFVSNGCKFSEQIHYTTDPVNDTIITSITKNRGWPLNSQLLFSCRLITFNAVPHS